MMDHQENHEPELIPEEFHSFETGAPFSHCIECDKNLMDGQPYLIEKAYRNHREYGVRDTIFDYALCLDCAEALKNEMSKESMDALMKFFGERMDIHQQLERASRPATENIKSCMISGRDMNDCDEYQIYAYCVNNTISNQLPPYMISGQVMEEVLPLLSKKTTDDLNGFFNKHFSPDPSLMEPIGPKFVLV